MLVVLKRYSHPVLKDVTLAVVMQALADPCRLAIMRKLLSARGRELSCTTSRFRSARPRVRTTSMSCARRG